MRRNRKEYVKTNKQNNPLPCPKINRINPVVTSEKKDKIGVPEKEKRMWEEEIIREVIWDNFPELKVLSF